MVPKGEMDVTERTAVEAHMSKYRKQKTRDDRKKSSWYRLFFPNKADYTLKENPYVGIHKDDVYNPATGFYSSIHNHYRDHHQE
jgi:hypothetical protein